MLSRIRAFFAARGVLEVETPILSTAGTTDPNLHSFAATSLAPGDSATLRYLHTSPEFAMKRLLAAGSGSIYQLARVFRAGESGRRHNPEFTMLEWYRLGFDLPQLMDEVATLVMEVLEEKKLAPTETLTYRDAFLRHTAVDPHTASATDFAACARSHNIDVSGLTLADVDAWRDLLLTHLVEPQLGRGRLTFIHDYPASQAALARIRPGKPPVAERFELYLDGIELANGFHELTYAPEQRQRFEQDCAVRAQRGLASVPADESLLAALAGGLPDCSGVALGFDRVVMITAGKRAITDVIAFPVDRA